MVSKPKISIIMPTYNRKQIIDLAIDSVLCQNYDDCEIIVIDDKSSDNTIEHISDKYGNKVRTLSLKENSGANIARNRGVDISKGEWLLFLDSDDTLRESSLDYLSKLIEKVESNMIFSACVDSNGNVTSNNPEFEGYLTYQEFICKKINGEYIALIKKDSFVKCYFDETTRRAPSIGFARMAKLTGNVYFSKFIARNYNTEIEDSITKSKKSNYKEMKKVWGIILKDQGFDKFKNCPKNFIISVMKYYYYYFYSIFQNKYK